MCGGSLIDKKTVLTAAHCLNDANPYETSQYTVYLGVHDLTDMANGVVVSSVKKVVQVCKFFFLN